MNAPERLVDPRRIAYLLQQLHARRATLALRAPASPVAASSLVLAVDPGRGAVLLDALFPSPAQAAVRSGAELPFSARLDGVAVEGRLRVRAVEPRRDGDVIVAELPRELLWVQRRAAFRVPVSGWASSQVIAQGARHRARIVDVSVLGLGATLASEVPVPAGAETLWELHLPQGSITAPVLVRSARREPGGVLRLGGQYARLAPPQWLLLERTVAQLQRAGLQGSPPGTGR